MKMKISSFLACLVAVPCLAAGTERRSGCHYLPGDEGWPADETWQAFNSSIGGRLVATVPIGTPCHDPAYDGTACSALQDVWTHPETHVATSSSMMQSFFANDSCSPFTAESKPCTLGNYVSYAVNVSTSADIVAAVKFTTDHNIRFVVRNTGHDYFGRSTGAGALSVWTHHLKSTELVDYSADYYTGQALKAGSGIEGFEAGQFADEHGLVALTGDCATVGLAGGYSQGGGHSALSTSFGLGADQVLEYEVVTTQGDILVASPNENEDLYWALSGGGGGTYAIVTSITIRLRPTAETGGAAFLLLANSTTAEKYDEAVSSFIGLLPQMTDAGASIVYLQTATAFQVQPITVFNSTGDYVKETVVAPWQKTLDELKVKVDIAYATHGTYHEHFATYFGPLPYGYFPATTSSYGSRLIPRSVVEDGHKTFHKVQTKIVTTPGAGSIGSVAAHKKPEGYPANAVLPAWRDATIHIGLALPWDNTDWAVNLAAQNTISDELIPLLEDITPGGGSYVNEAGVNTPNWKESFFGENYDKLLEVKQKYDPHGVLYGLKLVGSDQWTVDNDGRMCRA